MFYEYHQNNSGGVFTYDAKNGISTTVIIEADSAEEANTRAREIGLYFDGVDAGSDCACCGDRWYPAWEAGTESPSHYGEPLVIENNAVEKRPSSVNWMGSHASFFIHYKDGRIEGARFA
jgi:hypothetical protein